MKQFFKVSVLVLALGTSPAIHAATIALTPAGTAVMQGGQVTFDLIADFGDTRLLGGATDITWDSSALSFSGFTFADEIGDLSFNMAIPGSSKLTVALGSLSGFEMNAGSTIGSVTFTAIGSAGSSTQVVLADNSLIGWLSGSLFNNDDDARAGSFTAKESGHDKGKFESKDWSHDKDFFGKGFSHDKDFPKLDFDKIDVDYTGASVEITPVPLPAAGWLLLGALGGLAMMRRREGSTQQPALS